MKVPYNWLKTYIDFPFTPEELAHRLTMAGLEVEDVEYAGEGLEEIIIGEVEEVQEHPDADKLHLCKVNTGEDKLQIICGAPNVRENIKVPVAPMGVELPTGMKIKAAEIRGVKSEGMICSRDELGLMEERAEGIMILSEKAPVGEQFIKHLGLDEYILKLDLTPNYARCLGLLGIAREIKAMLDNGEVHYPDTNYSAAGKKKITDYVEVQVQDTELCPRYTGMLIKDVEIQESPLWLRRRLEAAGIRPINNIVDITNYVLLEYNQPLHAFDYERVAGEKVIVRRAREDETLITLDDIERELNSEVLVIADEEKPIGLAGVMGGANSEITATTSDIFLESAYFDPVNIRRTSSKLGIPSEAAHRFERGIDIENCGKAARRAAYLMEKYAGGKIVEGIIDEYPSPYSPKEIELGVKYCNKILGVEIPKAEMVRLLEKLEFTVHKRQNKLVVEVPSYRNDVTLAADLIEEIARMYGYNKIPITVPPSRQTGKRTEKQKLEDTIKRLLGAAGLDEVYTFSLTDKTNYDRMNIPADDEQRQWVSLKNPLNKAFSLLRTSLLPGMVEILSNNARRQSSKMGIFEIGRVFTDKGKNERPREEKKLAGASMGYSYDPLNTEAPDFYYLKGVIEKLALHLSVNKLSFRPVERPYFHPGRAAEIRSQQELIGVIGEIHPEVQEEFDLIEGSTVFQLDLEKLLDAADRDELRFASIPRHPAVSRDLALLVGQDITTADLLKVIEESGGKLLQEAEVFDLYQGSQIPEGQKSIAFQLMFQAEDRTLTDEEVNEVFTRIVGAVEDKYKAEIRGN